MVTEKKEDLLTAGNIAKELGISDARVKKAINQLALQPKATKGVCSYYSRNQLTKIQELLKQ